MTLAEYLDATGRKVTDVAKETGVSATSVYRWMSGARTPSPEQMRAVHAATKGLVTPNDFVLGPRS